MKSSELRKEMEVFDTFLNRISKKAMLKDTDYIVPPVEALMVTAVRANKRMAAVLEVEPEALPSLHTGSNGRWDCDDYTNLGNAIVRALWEVNCRVSKPAAGA